MKEELSEIIKKLPSNKEMAKSMLELVNNKDTEVEFSDKIKANYYIYINNKMYISKNAQNANDLNRGIVIAHECIHSIQNKRVQFLNFLLSNIYILAYILTTILLLFKVDIFLILTTIAIATCIVRVVLEEDAVKRSIDLFSEYLRLKTIENNEKVILYFSRQIKFALFIYPIKIFLEKIISIVILCALKIYIF